MVLSIGGFNGGYVFFKKPVPFNASVGVALLVIFLPISPFQVVTKCILNFSGIAYDVACPRE